MQQDTNGCSSKSEDHEDEKSEGHMSSDSVTKEEKVNFNWYSIKLIIIINGVGYVYEPILPNKALLKRSLHICSAYLPYRKMDTFAGHQVIWTMIAINHSSSLVVHD